MHDNHLPIEIGWPWHQDGGRPHFNEDLMIRFKKKRPKCRRTEKKNIKRCSKNNTMLSYTQRKRNTFFLV